MLKPSGVWCLYRYLFKENPQLSLKKKIPFYVSWPGCLIQKTLIKNFGGSSKLNLTTVGGKPKWKVCEGLFIHLNFLLFGNARRGAFSFPMWLFPLFLIILDEKGIVVHDYIIKPLSCLESNVTWAKGWSMLRDRWYYSFHVLQPLS